MKIMKRMSFMLLAILASATLKAYDAYIDGIYYNLFNDKAEVTYKYSFFSTYYGDVIIPETIRYEGKEYIVTSIGNQAFMNSLGLTSVTIPSTVVSIGTKAFYGNEYLITIRVNNKTPLGIESDTFSNQANTTLIVPEGCRPAYSNAEYWNEFKVIKEIAMANDFCYLFDIDNMVAEVQPKINNSKYSGNVVIPSSVIYDNETYSVTGIGEKAFYNCSGMTSIIIPGSIAFIGGNAFYGCKGLTDITIPESITSIGDYAFYGCSGLTAVVIPKSVTNIGVGLFSRCSNLTSIIVEEENPKYDSRNDCNAVVKTATNTLVLGCKTSEIPESVTSIGNYAFHCCEGLTSVTLPDNLTSIGNYAFHCCEGLTSVTLPDNLTSIGSYGFSYCSFKSITIPDKVKTIGNFAFINCEKLTSVTLGNSLTSIGNSAFEGCSGLSSVIIPSCVTNIGNFAFSHCTSLSSVVIGSGVENIGDWAFESCRSLISVKVERNTPPAIPDNVFDSSTQCSATLYVPVGSKTAYSNAENWKDFEKIKECLPEAEVDGIYYSFDIVNMVAEVIPKVDYSKYTGDVNIPSSITYDNITYDVTSIADWTFYDCDELTAITIPKSVTNIGEDAFWGCSGLISINVEEENSKYDSRNDCNAVIETSTNTLVLGCKTTEIPESVTSIGDCAFAGCKELNSITIPKNVTSIGDLAFYGCNSLLSIIIPENVTYLGWGSFYECSNLTSISIPSGVTNLEDYSFYGCKALTSVSLPNRITTIGIAAFYDCGSLTTLTIPKSVTTIGEFAFSYCNNLTSIDIPEGITSVKEWTFCDCSALKEINISNNVTSIEKGAFANCTGLTSFTIPKNVEIIGEYTFNGCNCLQEIYCYAEETPDVYFNTFTGVVVNAYTLYNPFNYSTETEIEIRHSESSTDLSIIQLFVSQNSVEKYKAHPVWGQFLIDTTTDIDSTPEDMEEKVIYNLSGQRIPRLQRGLNIIGGKKVLVK